MLEMAIWLFIELKHIILTYLGQGLEALVDNIRLFACSLVLLYASMGSNGSRSGHTRPS